MELLTPKGTEVLLRDLVQERTGMLYDNNKESILLDKLAPLVIERGFHSFLDYYYLLKYDDNNEDEWALVMNAISVQETFFWREMDQINSLVDILVPQWVEQRGGECLRIWSAGCATGEEPLTIAMSLTEAGWFEKLPIEIVATDASASAIAKAQAGLYRERSFRSLPVHLRNRYFSKEGSDWRVDPQLHKRVTYKIANLVRKEDVLRYATVPFVLCRNVFIYFSSSTVTRVVRCLADYMRPPGYLFIGVSESLLKTTMEFDLIDVGSAFVYKRLNRVRPMSLKDRVSELKGHG